MWSTGVYCDLTKAELKLGTSQRPVVILDPRCLTLPLAVLRIMRL
jgi:hypothetical protein